MKDRIIEKRTAKILDILTEKGQIKINLLADLIDISQVTIRKDLDKLEEKGIIQRTHGYAGLASENEAGRRMAYYYLIKRRIAKAATKSINDGETIMIESGSCCAFFAEELAFSKKNITVVTNSIFILNHLQKERSIKIIMLGGYYQPDSQVMVGPITSKCGDIHLLDKFFLGADGFIPEYGFTGRDHLRAETAANLAGYAKNVYILTESAKFNRRSAYSLIQSEKIAGVFTDDNIPKEAEDILTQKNVKIFKVPSAPVVQSI